MKRIVVDSSHPETTIIPAERIKIPVVNYPITILIKLNNYLRIHSLIILF